MTKVHKVEFSTDGITAEELKAKMNSVIDKAITEDKKEMKHIDAFIVAVINLVKVIVNDKNFSANADEFASDLLKQSNGSKRSFYTYYSKCIEDTTDDIVCLVKEFKELNKNNND